MLTPEAHVKLQVKRMLKDYKCYTLWPVQNGMGSPTLDCLGCHNGKFFAIETKAPGKKPTARQEITIRDMQESNGATFVIDGSPASLAALKFWLEVTQ